MDHARRLHRLIAERERPLLVTSLVNIRYLTGFTGTAASLLVTAEECVFATDGRYGELAEELAGHLEVTRVEVSTTGMLDLLAGLVGSAAEVDLEADHVTWSFLTSLQDKVAYDPPPDHRGGRGAPAGEGRRRGGGAHRRRPCR